MGLGLKVAHMRDYSENSSRPLEALHVIMPSLWKVWT